MKSQTTKQKTALLISKAEESNPDLWNCLIDIVYDVKSMTLELDQFINGSNDLYQIGTGEFVTSKFEFHSSLN